MKIALLCRGRTRSTAVIEYLSKVHNIQNKSEIYFTNHKFVLSPQYSIKNHKKLYIEKLCDFQNLLNNTTTELLNIPSFICKIWPSMLVYPPSSFSYDEDLSSIKNRTIFDITNTLKLKEYNKVVVLNRDLITSSLSWVYAKHTNVFSVLSHQKRKFHKIKLNELDLDFLRFYILEYCLQEKIVDYLDKTELKYEIFSGYDSLTNNIQLRTKDSKNNYDLLIENLDDTKQFISNFYKSCQIETKDWYFY